MSSKSAASIESKGHGPPITEVPSVRHGELDVVSADEESRAFYGSSVSDAYRLKSELVAAHLSEIGMGKQVASCYSPFSKMTC